MTRKLRFGQKPISEYEVYHGYDVDVKTWFVEIQIPKLGSGNITKWYQTQSEYEKALKKVLWTVSKIN